MTVWKQGVLNPIVILAGGQVGDNGTSPRKLLSHIAHICYYSQCSSKGTRLEFGYQSFLNFCNHQTVKSITVSSPERSYIEYTRIPSPMYQHMSNLVVSMPIRRGPGMFINVSVWAHHTLHNQIFWCSKVDYSNTIIITILM